MQPCVADSCQGDGGDDKLEPPTISNQSGAGGAFSMLARAIFRGEIITDITPPPLTRTGSRQSHASPSYAMTEGGMGS